MKTRLRKFERLSAPAGSGRLLQVGDRVRLKVRTIFGYKGTGTVTREQYTASGGIQFRPDEEGWEHNTVDCMRHEVALMRCPNEKISYREGEYFNL